MEGPAMTCVEAVRTNWDWGIIETGEESESTYMRQRDHLPYSSWQYVDDGDCGCGAGGGIAESVNSEMLRETWVFNRQAISRDVNFPGTAKL